MTPSIRIIDTAQRSARWNIAMTAALVELHQAGRIEDTIRFHRYPRSVLIGRHQALADAVVVEHCNAANIECARRITGGGAVYMASNALAWDVVIARNCMKIPVHEVAEAICKAVAKGLSQLGISARYRPQNEIEVDGRKISGSSGYIDGDTLVFQGTVLVDTSIEDMGRFLRLPKSGGPSHGDLGARITSLREQLGRIPDTAEIQELVAVELSGLFGRVQRWETPSFEESTLADRLHAVEFGLDAFVCDGLPASEAFVVTGCDGMVQASIRLLPGLDRRIDQIWLTGAFRASPARAIGDVEAGLRGLPLEAAPDRAMELLSSANIELHGTSRFAISAAIRAAGRIAADSRRENKDQNKDLVHPGFV